MLKILKNRTFILVFAFVSGLLFSDLAQQAGPLTMPALAFVLTISATQLSLQQFRPLKMIIRPIIFAILLNYLLLGAVILVLAWLLMPTRDLWIGYVLVAAAPPGIAIIPFTYILKGDLRSSMTGTFGAFLLSLLLTPTIVYLFTGEAAVSPYRLLSTIILLILLPFFLSQLLRKSRANLYIAKWRGTMVNWGFFLVISTVVGLNSNVFLKDYHVLIPVSIVAAVSCFGLAYSVELIGKKLYLNEPERISYILLSTIKNSAFAAAVGLALYSEAASVPGAVISAWYALYFVLMGMRADKKSKMDNPKEAE